MSLTAFHSAASGNQETSGVRPKIDSWWTDFHDSLLTQTIQEALAQNLDLAASLDRVEQARAAAREAGAQLCPDIIAAERRLAASTARIGMAVAIGGGWQAPLT
jgi:outer membrane protein TolC